MWYAIRPTVLTSAHLAGSSAASLCGCRYVWELQLLSSSPNGVCQLGVQGTVSSNKPPTNERHQDIRQFPDCYAWSQSEQFFDDPRGCPCSATCSCSLLSLLGKTQERDDLESNLPSFKSKSHVVNPFLGEDCIADRKRSYLTMQNIQKKCLNKLTRQSKLTLVVFPLIQCHVVFSIIFRPRDGASYWGAPTSRSAVENKDGKCA